MEPKRVLVTGAAGNIGYAIIPLIASGGVFGPNQPIILHLLDIPFCEEKLKGVVMEIEDCAFPLVEGIVSTVDVKTAFTDIDFAFLVGSFPRKEGMERKELLAKNADIFKVQGGALDKYSKKTVKVLVVGNPANTNCLIASACAPSIPKENFTAMTRLDHNRATSMLANKAGVLPSTVNNVIIWGNHSSTQVPDATFAVSKGKSIVQLINDQPYLDGDFITNVQKRGAAIIKARGASSVFSAAFAAVSHVRDWVQGTPEGVFVSMGIPSDGSYGIPKGVIFSYPVRVQNGVISIVQDLALTDNVKALMQKSNEELLEEKKEAFDFLGIS